MILKSPVMITARLLPGVKIGPATVSIEYITKRNFEGRTEYRVHIDHPEFTYTDEDSKSGWNLARGTFDLFELPVV